MAFSVEERVLMGSENAGRRVHAKRKSCEEVRDTLFRGRKSIILSKDQALLATPSDKCGRKVNRYWVEA
jgi:hypothetical protein